MLPEYYCQGMNIPMYGALKRCTPLVNLVLSVVYLKKPVPSPLLITSVFTITFGCLVAGEYDCDAGLWVCDSVKF